MLPEVRAAMDAASRQYVHLDELAESIGARLATLTGAEWGLVTAGCSAALTHATAACLTGGNPDLQVRLPNLSGFAKDEVIIPKHSRNVYDAAVRAVGTRIIEVSSVDELQAALGPRTAMIYVLAGTSADQSVLNIEGDRAGRQSRRVCRFSWTPPPRFSRSRTSTCRTAPRWWPIAEANACVDRRPQGCCSAARIWCARRGCTARRIMAPGAR